MWTAVFYESGALAFWFCSRCGEVDRDTDCLSEPLESDSSSVTAAADLSLCAVTPPACLRRWKLADGSVLSELSPCSVSFKGVRIPGLATAHSYDLYDSEGTVIRTYRASRERASNHPDSFILTRFQVKENRFIKYRVNCRGEQPVVNKPSGIAILSGLIPVQS
jgi:hypothetical protein